MAGSRTVLMVLTSILITMPPPLARSATGPLLRISERKIDFGTVDQFQQLHHSLVLRNEGDRPLRILKVETSCGCTAAVPADSIVPPGKEVKIDVAFSTREYEGPQEKTLTLRTNDPAEPVVRVAVLADVKPYVRMDPTVLHFDTVPRGDTPTQKVHFSADKGFGLAIGKVEGGEDHFKVLSQPVPSSKEEAVDVILTLRRDAPPGQFRTIFKIQTKGKIERTFDLLATGDVVSYFVVASDVRVRMPTLAQGKAVSTRIPITCAGNKPYKVTSVQSDLPYLTGQIIPNGPGYIIVLGVDPSAPAGDYMGKVDIRTTDPAQPAIQLIVKGFVRK